MKSGKRYTKRKKSEAFKTKLQSEKSLKMKQTCEEKRNKTLEIFKKRQKKIIRSH